MEDSSINATIATIYQRHSIRQFANKPVDDADIRLILDTANQAPSAHNQQSWQFIVIRGGKKKELSQLVSYKAGKFAKPSAAIPRMAARSLANAPVVIAVKNTGSLIRHGSDLFKIELERSWIFSGQWKSRAQLLRWKTFYLPQLLLAWVVSDLVFSI